MVLSWPKLELCLGRSVLARRVLTVGPINQALVGHILGCDDFFTRKHRLQFLLGLVLKIVLNAEKEFILYTNGLVNMDMMDVDNRNS